MFDSINELKNLKLSRLSNLNYKIIRNLDYIIMNDNIDEKTKKDDILDIINQLLTINTVIKIKADKIEK